MSDKRFTIDIEDMDDLEALERFNIKLSNLESEYDTTFVDGRDSTKVYIQDNVAPEIEDIDSSMFDPIEGRAEEGDIVATFRVTDIDGNLDRVAVTPSDTYSVINIEDDMYQLVLKEAGASLINSGGDLGDIHITAYDTFESQNSIDLEAPDTYTMPQITLSDATINEDDGTMTYIVTLSKLPDENHPVELRYQTSDGSATAGDDYTSVSGDISWDHNSTDLTYTIEVPILSDDIVEDSETFNIDFSFKDEDVDFVEFTGGMSAEVTIEDSGTTTLTLTNAGGDLDGYENFAGEGYVLSTPPGGLEEDTVLKVSLDEIENSINQNDIKYCKYYYELNSETVTPFFTIGEEFTIPKGATNIRFAVQIQDDEIYEHDEYILIKVDSLTDGTTINHDIDAYKVINDDDARKAGTLHLDKINYTVDEDAGEVVILVNRLGGTTGSASVYYETSDDSATEGSDYGSTSGRLRWGNGDSSSKEIRVPIKDDDIEETLESFKVTLSDPRGGARLGDSEAVISIKDNDDTSTDPGEISLGSSAYTVDEDAGSVTITVQRTGGSYGAATATIDLSDITALAGSDYIDTDHTFTWADGESGDKTFTISILDDSEVEGDETFKVELSSIEGANEGDIQESTVTINDDDDSTEPGKLSFASTQYEVNEDAGTVTILVNRMGGSEGEISVDYRTSDISATKGSDYAQSSGTLSWSDGDSTPKEIVIDIHDDNIEEILESFKVELLDPMGGAELGDREAVIEIVDNDTDTLLTLTGGDISVNEGGEFIYNLSMPSSGLSEDTILKVSLDDFSIANRYDFSGVFYKIGGGDYQEFELGGEITIPQGTSEGIEFKFVSGDDTAYEGNENFDIKVEPLTSGVIVEDTTSVSTILDGSDTSPSAGTLHLDKINYTVDEEGRVTILVNRIGGSEGAISVEYKTVDGSAESGSDYTSKSGTLTWEAGDTSAKKIKIDISEDDIFELLENFQVELSNPTGGVALGDSVATIDIVDNDALILTNESELSKFESHSGSETTFTYGLSTPADGLPSDTKFTISLDDLSTVEMQDFDRVVCRYNGDQTLEIELGRSSP
jgi:hypothetical protein